MGDNIYLGDRNGVRTPMQWSADRNAGFSRANPQRLYLPTVIDPDFHYETVNVETQLANPHSLLWWMRRLIALRTRHHVFGRGSLEFLTPENHKVIAFVRRHGDDVILVVANLSRFAQYVELELPEFRGLVPRELLGRTLFPPIGDLPYLLTLGPHAFYWLSLERPQAEIADVRTIAVAGKTDNLFAGPTKRSVEDAISGFIQRQRWFAGKARAVHDVSIRDVFSVRIPDRDPAMLALVDIEYVDGEPEAYVLPLAVAVGEHGERILADVPQAVVARLAQRGGAAAVLYDALYDERFCAAMLDGIAKRRRFRGSDGSVVGRPTAALRRVMKDADGRLDPDLFRAEQSNSSVLFGHAVILKLFRKIEGGVNPDLELGLFLGQRNFPHAPAVVGAMEYEREGMEPVTVAIAHEVVANPGRRVAVHVRRPSAGSTIAWQSDEKRSRPRSP